MKDKEKTYEKAKMFMDKVLQDENARTKNIKSLMELKRIANASNMLNNFAIGVAGASAVAIGTAFVLGGISMPIVASVILGASIIGILGGIRAKVKDNGNYAINRVNEHKKENEQTFVLSKEATVNYLGDLSLPQINKLGKYVEKEYSQNTKTAKSQIQFELENTFEKEDELASHAIYDTFANASKTISKIIPNKEERQLKQLELDAKKKRQKELDKELGLDL